MIKSGLITEENQNRNPIKSWFIRYRKYILVLARLLHAAHSLICLFATIKQMSSKYYLDILQSRSFKSNKIFTYVIVIAYNLFAAGLLCVFNFSDKCDKHWFQLLNQLVRNEKSKSSKSSKTIFRIRFALKYIRISSMSINVALIGFSMHLTIMAYNGMDFLIYGVPSIVLFFNALRAVPPTALLFIFSLLIVTLYCYQQFKQLNNRLKNISKGHVMNEVLLLKPIKRLNAEHNGICVQIHRYNKFWQQTLLITLVTVIPLNLFLIHQLIFGQIDNFFQYYLFLIATIQTVGLSSLVILITALVYRESKRAVKYLTSILVKFPLKLSDSIKVSEPITQLINDLRF